MALPRKYLAEKSSGSEFKLLSTADLSPTDAIIGPGSSTPGDFAVWGGYDGKTLVDGFVHTEPDGALDGDGTPSDPLAVRVDGVSVTINASNELEATGVGASVVTSPTGALDGDGSVSSPLAVRVDGVTIQVNASNELESLGGSSTVTVSTALAGDGSGGDPVRVLVDNETIGVDSTNKLEVIQRYAVADGNLDIGTLVQGDGGTHVSKVTVGTGLALSGGTLSATGGSGTVTNTGTLTSGKTIVGNGGVDVTVSSLTAQFVGSTTGTAAAASMSTGKVLGRTTAGSGAVEEISPTTGLTLAAGSLAVKVDNETIGVDSNNKLQTLQRNVIADGNLDIGTLVQGDGGTHVSKVTIGTGLSLSGGVLTNTATSGGTVHVAANGALTGDGSIGSPLAVHPDNESIGVDSQNKLQVIGHYIPSGAPRHALGYSGGYLDVQVDNETIGINTHNQLEALLRSGELDYTEFQASVSPTATTEATANTVVSGRAVKYNGTTSVLIEFFTIAARPDTSAANRTIVFYLYEDSGSIGRLGSMGTPAAQPDTKPVYLVRRMRPSAGIHTYSIRAAVSAGTGLITAGTGGLGGDMPGFIRITVT